MKYVLLAVEGPHDRALIEKLLKSNTAAPFTSWNGKAEKLLPEDAFWKPLLAADYPFDGDYFKRTPAPAILRNGTRAAVAVLAAEGSNLKRLPKLLELKPELTSRLHAFGVIVDADDDDPPAKYDEIRNLFLPMFKHFPSKGGQVSPRAGAAPRTGGFVIPDNLRKGAVEALLLDAGAIAYPDLLSDAMAYVDTFDSSRQAKYRAALSDRDRDKAIVASVASLLKPGKSNTVSIADNNWISKSTLPVFAALDAFLGELLE